MKERIRNIYAEKHEHDVHISFDEIFSDHFKNKKDRKKNILIGAMAACFLIGIFVGVPFKTTDDKPQDNFDISSTVHINAEEVLELENGLVSLSENFNQPAFVGELGDVGNVPLQMFPPQILSPNIFNRINEVKEFRDNENYTEALAVLDDIKIMNDAGTLNDREQIVMWGFYANIAQLEGSYDNTIVAFNQILQIESLSAHNRALTKRYLDSLNYLPESSQ